MQIYSKIKNGKLDFNNPVDYKQWLKTTEEGDDVLVTFELLKDSKTLQQLRLTYLLFREISSHTGYTVSEVKTLIKIEQGLCGVHTIQGKEVTFCKSLSEFNKKELSEFIIKMDRWANLTLDLKLLSFNDIEFLKNI